ncbi:MAG: 2-phospho-L-lactate guanylyltransferase [Rhodospirillaceae bacterium]|nr:2-phospho-L-lactate guanylyltransferase [Rhodospirillaceae bacterium]
MSQLHRGVLEKYMVVAVVPLKNLKLAKSRLSNILAEGERKELVLAMFDDVLVSLRASHFIDEIFIVADKYFDPVADVQLITEIKNRGYDEAIVEALKDSRINQAQAMLILPADLPLVSRDELNTLIKDQEDRSIRIAGARDQDGTNALVMKPPHLLATSFGVGSFKRHKKFAKALSVKIEEVNLPGLSFDVDTEKDLIDFVQTKSDTRTYRFLDESGIIGRLNNL